MPDPVSPYKIDHQDMAPDPEYYEHPKWSISLECWKLCLLFASFSFPMLYAAYDQGGWGQVWFPALMLFFPILSTFLRRKLRMLVPFILVHAGFGAYVYLLSPNDLMSLFGYIFVIMLFVYGMYRHMTHEEERDMSYATLYLAIGMMLLTYLACTIRGHEEYQTALLAQGLVYSLLFLSYQHRTSISRTLSVMDSRDNFSTKRTIRFNKVVFLAYMGLLALAFALLYALGLSKWLTLGGQYLMLGIRRLVRFLTKTEPAPGVKEEEAAAESNIQEEASQMLVPAGKTARGWVVAQRILVVVFVVVVVLLLIYVLVRTFQRFHKTYGYSEKNYTENKTFYTREKTVRRRRTLREMLDLGPEDKIRKAYYNTVKHKIDKTVLRSDTPSQAAGKEPEIAPLVDRYDQVRYDPAYGKEPSWH